MLTKFSDGSNTPKQKLCFESQEQAAGYIKSISVGRGQVPYLCQFCHTWHLGNSSRLGTDERRFVVTGVGDLQIREVVSEDSPLYKAANDLQLEKFKLSTIGLNSFQRIIDQYKLPNISPNLIRTFVATPQQRAIVWAIHMVAPRQIVMLVAPNGRLVFKRNAGDFWHKHLIESNP